MTMNQAVFIFSISLPAIFIIMWIISLKSIYRFRVTLFASLSIFSVLFLANYLTFLQESYGVVEYYSLFFFTSYILGTINALISFYIFICNIVLISKERFAVSKLLGLYLFIGFIISLILTRFLLVAIFMCYADSLFLGYCVMCTIAAKKRPKYDKDFIIILGCSINTKGGLLPLLKDRTNKAIRFAWDQERANGHKCCYVPTGGQGRNEIKSEGSAIELYLLSHGAEDYEVFPEKASTSTYENMLFAKAVIEKEYPDATVAFCTSGYHVYRSGIIARKAGLNIEGIGSRVKWYYWPNGFVREFIGFLSIHKKENAIASGVCVALTVLGFILK